MYWRSWPKCCAGAWRKTSDKSALPKRAILHEEFFTEILEWGELDLTAQAVKNRAFIFAQLIGDR